MAASAKSQTAFQEKRKILDAGEYNQISSYVRNFKGLAIDCEIELISMYPDVNLKTLQGILQNELSHRIRFGSEKYRKLAETFNKRNLQEPGWLNRCTIVDMAVENSVMPGGLCRAIIRKKFNHKTAAETSRVLKYPQLLKDSGLEECVRQALMSDTQEGPWIDLERRLLGEEYEYKLRTYAASYGFQYKEEKSLRMLGFDKTPDLKLEIPCLYKGTVISWIESKAMFADLKMHKYYDENQYNSYVNRFGAGIVIYWFGFQKKILNPDLSTPGVIILDHFPSVTDLVLLQFEKQKLPKTK